MVIDNNRIEFDDEKNILDVVRKAGIDLPTLCYYSDLSIYGACRMCMVEDEKGRMIASCSTPPKDKMEIKTNTPKLFKHRKMILELILASHCRDCTICNKNGSCRLQELATRFVLDNIRFKNSKKKKIIDTSSNAIVIDSSKCILCGDCVRMCNEIQNVGAIDFANRGSDMVVTPAFNKCIAQTDCVSCGQCSAVCPTGAITVKSSIKQVWDAIYDPKKRVVMQIAPAVRVALGEEYKVQSGANVMNKIAAAVRIMGVDDIFDTSVGADLTTIEESKELLDMVENRESRYPLFTSCCPAWVNYCEKKHPELMKYVSSCKSPMEMLGVVVKKYFKEKDDIENKETINVAVMPCTAKKDEIERIEFKRNGLKDVDYVLTTSELCRMINESGIQFNEIEAESINMPFSIHSGGGVIFGASGGVTEAVLRNISDDCSEKKIKEIQFVGMRGMEGIKKAEIDYKGTILKIAVVSGLKNAERIIEMIESNEEYFDFVEVMACRGGCIGGAGQPFGFNETKILRAKGLYKADKMSKFKVSRSNPVAKDIYEDVLKNDHYVLHVSRINK